MSVIASVIEGRYQIIGRIASGGMGEVYRGHDPVLSRDVAIKVLHPHLAQDRGFVDRFRREARAAAGLNHPSIVGVYDWGSAEGTYFMVMEHVPGTNLRALLSEAGRLEPAQVVEVVLPVLAALDHAHGHGIVHRDVKPENILIARDGVVKVADFGLARAYADSYVSQAEGVVVGTVQYLAPEQIRGEPADPRTDLYALGVVMFELLTGDPPFSGETSLAIAYQHLSASVPAPSATIPALPTALDDAVLAATRKDRDERPRSARSLAQHIERAAASLPPAPRVAEVAAQIPASSLTPVERATTVTIPRAPGHRPRGRRRWRWLAFAAALVVSLAIGAWAVWAFAVPHYAVVPNVQGLTARQAEARLLERGFTARTGPGVFSTTMPVGRIVTSRPPPGTRLRKGDAVLLIPSLGVELLRVPALIGETEADARRSLTDAGFQTAVRRAYDEDVRKGSVIAQSPEAGVRVERGSTVVLTISRGPAPVEVPELAGRPEDEAKVTLEALGFSVDVAKAFSTDVDAGDVIRTDPPAGDKVTRGSTVTLLVSKGPERFPMPNVVGMSVTAAKDRLERLGLQVKIVDVEGFEGTVVLQKPAPSTTVQQGQLVSIYA